MAITKIQSGAIPADTIDTTHIGDVGADKITGQVVSSQISDLGVTHAKLHTTMDLSSKTVTLPSLSQTIVNSSHIQMGGNLDVVGQIGAYDNPGSSWGKMILRATDFELKNAGGTINMVLDTSGNVGIGNSSPTSNLTIGSTQNDGLEFTYDATNAYRNKITNYWNSSADTRMDFDIGRSGGVAPVTVMSVGYNSNVGIGTTSPTGALSVVDSTSTDTLYLESSDTARVTLKDTSAYAQGTGPYIQFQGKDNAGTNRNFGQIWGISDTANNGELDFKVRSSGSMISAMRIDSSGNLLVGTTDKNIRDSSSAEGMVYRNGDSLDINRSAAPPLIVNRVGNSDGDLVLLRKDGATVGSIGVESSDNLTIGGTTANHSGLLFGTNTIIPMQAGSGSDATQDLGNSGSRFKDLYLSGGIQFNSRSNKLDDYEEGTWVPTLSSTGGTINSSKTCGYIRIGRTMFLFGQARFTNPGSIGSAHAKLSTPTTPANIFSQSSNDVIIPMWTGGTAASKNYWNEGYPSISMLTGATNHHLYRHHRSGAEGLGGNDFGGELNVNFNGLFYAE